MRTEHGQEEDARRFPQESEEEEQGQDQVEATVAQEEEVGNPMAKDHETGARTDLDESRKAVDEASTRTSANAERGDRIIAEMGRLQELNAESVLADDNRRAADDERRVADDGRRAADDDRRAADDVRRDEDRKATPLPEVQPPADPA